MADARILENVDIFSDLSTAQLELIFTVCRERTYGQGAMVVEEFTPSTEFYIVLDGELEVLVGQNESGGPKRIAALDHGSSFGEIALVDQGLRSASVRCVSESCRLLVINRDDLMKLMKENLELGFKVIYNLAADLCLKIRNTQYLAREPLLYGPIKSF